MKQIMNRLFKNSLILTILLVPGILFSQKIDNKYTSLKQEKGVFFFIKPIKGFKSIKKNNKFIYDITFITIKDTAVFNFSYFEKRGLDINRIMFKNENFSLSYKASKLFIDTKNAKWHYRYTVNIPFIELSNFFAGNNLIITLETQQGDVKISMSKRKWKGHSAKMNKIMILIKLNIE